MASAIPSTAGPVLRAATAVRLGIATVASVMNLCAGWAYIAAAIFITVDVTCRKFFGFNSGATTEISGYLLGFGISWALAQTMVERAHIRIDLLVMRMPLVLRQYLHLAALSLLIALVGVVGWSALTVIEESWMFKSHDISALSIPLLMPQSLWAFGIGVFALFLIALAFECLVLLVSGRPDEIDALLRPRSADEETTEALEAVQEGRPS